VNHNLSALTNTSAQIYTSMLGLQRCRSARCIPHQLHSSNVLIQWSSGHETDQGTKYCLSVSLTVFYNLAVINYVPLAPCYSQPVVLYFLSTFLKHFHCCKLLYI